MRGYKKWLSLFITIFLFLIIFLLGKLVPEQSLRTFIDEAGALGPLAVILLCLIAYIIAPISSTPAIFAGYYAYGKNVIFLATFASIISFVVNFWLARKWGRSLVQKLVGAAKMKKFDKFTENYGLLSLFFLRLLQAGLHDFVSYASGITKIRFWPYLGVSLLAEIPGTLLWYYVATKTNNPISFTFFTWLMAVVLSLIFLVGVLVTRKDKFKEILKDW